MKIFNTEINIERILAHVVRIVVGCLFIFSGLVKLNDPTGTQIKLEEYFEVFAGDLPSLHGFWTGLLPYSIHIAVFMCVLEVVLGVALLVSYKIRQTSWLLLAMVIYFTILTFYSAYFNKVTDCGCFGDFLKLKPWASFTKDVVLLVLILFILWQRKTYSSLRTGLLVSLSALASLGLAIYAISFLPPIDFLPYKIGNNIPAQMLPSEPLRYKYIMEKDGNTTEFEKYPTDTTYKYKEMVLVNEDARPKITDYKVWNDNGDFTPETFKGTKLMLIIKNSTELNVASLADIRHLFASLKKTNVELLILTSESINELKKSHQLDAPFYFADATVLKTISRSNPGLWLLKDGTVKGKWHYNSTPNAAQVMALVK
jgi:uncharacterized membrane protein YphA (DoxX/SURF4 family)